MSTVNHLKSNKELYSKARYFWYHWHWRFHGWIQDVPFLESCLFNICNLNWNLLMRPYFCLHNLWESPIHKKRINYSNTCSYPDKTKSIISKVVSISISQMKITETTPYFLTSKIYTFSSFSKYIFTKKLYKNKFPKIKIEITIFINMVAWRQKIFYVF
jgi:hypothetical protein